MKNIIRSLSFFCLIISADIFAFEKPPDVTYIHPQPGAQDITPQSSIILKFEKRLHDNLDASWFNFSVNAERSGGHTGEIIISDNTVIFKPHHAFMPAEKVHLSIDAGAVGWERPLQYSFTTHPIDEFDPVIFRAIADNAQSINQFSESSSGIEATGSVCVINGVSVPSDFPQLNPRILKDDIAPGRIFINNWFGTPYILILENDGSPYFYQRVGERSGDFKIQPNGMLTRRYQFHPYSFVSMDSNYAIVDTFSCTNGYVTDEHEFTMTSNGHYFLIALGYRIVDMSKIVAGGQPNATVIDCNIQEFDKKHNLVFEWLCKDYFNIRDATHESLKDVRIEYVHLNSIAVDFDENIVISCRHLSEITKINRNTGDIIWRLGGEHNQFTFVNDEYGISYQHDVRPVPGKPNHYTVFDNGNFHNPPFSRAVEFVVDTAAMTATRVWEFRHPNNYYTKWMGSVQRLPNGNTLIDWSDGSLPKATEVTADGDIVFEANFLDYSQCYRTFRFEWESVADKPYLIVESLPDKVTLIFNKFGDKNIKEYIVYGGTSAYALTPMDTTSNSIIHFTDLDNNAHYFFKVRAVNMQGQHSEFSDIVDVAVNYSAPGENLLRNGDFSQGKKEWDLSVNGGAAAYGSINTEGEYYLKISNGGSDVTSVQLKQEQVSLIQGRRYLFEYEAYAQNDRVIDARLERSNSPYNNYGEIGLTVLKKNKKSYTYEFTMLYPTDHYARVVFNCGSSIFDVYMDNISLKEIVPTDVAENIPAVAQHVYVFDNYPNPFNARTTIHFSVPRESHLTIGIYNVVGEFVREICDDVYQKGDFKIQFDGRGLSSGVYFCCLTERGKDDFEMYRAVRKILIIN